MKTKVCTKCRIEKSVEDFGVCLRLKSGRVSWCKVCTRLVTAERRRDPNVRERQKQSSVIYSEQNRDTLLIRHREQARRKQAFLNALKTKPCTECHKVFDPCCMDFDHVFGAKVKGVGQILGSCKQTVLAEVAKCELVCANCHRIRTRKQRGMTKNQNRLRFFERLAPLKAQPCADCGCRFPPEAMDFDHVCGTKCGTVAQMRSCSWDKVLQEIAKCELVCANCHRVRTQKRKRGSI